jgi:hypothetical protein
MTPLPPLPATAIDSDVASACAGTMARGLASCSCVVASIITHSVAPRWRQ